MCWQPLLDFQEEAPTDPILVPSCPELGRVSLEDTKTTQQQDLDLGNVVNLQVNSMDVERGRKRVNNDDVNLTVGRMHGSCVVAKVPTFSKALIAYLRACRIGDIQRSVTLTGDLGARILRRVGLLGGDCTSASTPRGSGLLIPAMAAKSIIPYSRATAIG